MWCPAAATLSWAHRVKAGVDGRVDRALKIGRPPQRRAETIDLGVLDSGRLGHARDGSESNEGKILSRAGANRGHRSVAVRGPGGHSANAMGPDAGSPGARPE